MTLKFEEILISSVLRSADLGSGSNQVWNLVRSAIMEPGKRGSGVFRAIHQLRRYLLLGSCADYAATLNDGDTWCFTHGDRHSGVCPRARNK